MSKMPQTIKPQNKVEEVLFKLPKTCDCPICTISKALAKESLSEKRYKMLCLYLGIQIQK